MLTALEDYWRSPEAKRAFQVASGSFEPTVRKIGDLVFGTRDKGVSPEFAKVLRLQILTKDRRWLRLKTGVATNDAELEPGQIPVTLAADPMPIPMSFEVPVQSPLTPSAATSKLPEKK